MTIHGVFALACDALRIVLRPWTEFVEPLLFASPVTQNVHLQFQRNSVQMYVVSKRLKAPGSGYTILVAKSMQAHQVYTSMLLALKVHVQPYFLPRSSSSLPSPS
jgi:hypothetical protein